MKIILIIQEIENHHVAQPCHHVAKGCLPLIWKTLVVSYIVDDCIPLVILLK